jgi:hypothetical protein
MGSLHDFARGSAADHHILQQQQLVIAEFPTSSMLVLGMVLSPTEQSLLSPKNGGFRALTPLLSLSSSVMVCCCWC